MSGAISIVIVHDDLKIAGYEDSGNVGGRGAKTDNELFNLMFAKHPDVIVVDCRGANRNGVSAIEKIRARVSTPILVVCDPDDPLQRKYRFAGAADCFVAPIDILEFNTLLHEVVRSAKSTSAKRFEPAISYHFNGIQFFPNVNLVTNGDASTKLTTLENRLLRFFVQRPQQVCSRREVSESLHGPNQPVSDRAIDVIVARLRKKLADVSGTAGETLLKTEFRLGYVFIGQVTGAQAQAVDRSVAEPTPEEV